MVLRKVHCTVTYCFKPWNLVQQANKNMGDKVKPRQTRKNKFTPEGNIFGSKHETQRERRDRRIRNGQEWKRERENS